MGDLPAEHRYQDTASSWMSRVPGQLVAALWALSGASVLADGLLALYYREPVMVVMRGITLILVGVAASTMAVWGNRKRDPPPIDRERMMKFFIEIGWQCRDEEGDPADEPSNVIQMRRPAPPGPDPAEWPAWIPQRGKHGA